MDDEVFMVTPFLLASLTIFIPSHPSEYPWRVHCTVQVEKDNKTEFMEISNPLVCNYLMVSNKKETEEIINQIRKEKFK